MMFVWKDQPRLINNLVRMSKGAMMGVDFNKDKTWIGASSGVSPAARLRAEGIPGSPSRAVFSGRGTPHSPSLVFSKMDTPAHSLHPAPFGLRGTDHSPLFEHRESVIRSCSLSSTIQDGEGMAREGQGMRECS